MTARTPARRPARRALTVLTAAAALLLAPTAPAVSAAPSYVALGDSYSAGTGTRASTGDCYRSAHGYPQLLASSRTLALNYQACSGATTADLMAKQIGSVKADTAVVTVTIGGNDVGFADVITACAQPAWISDCEGKLSAARTVLRTQMPTRLDNVYRSIRQRAPQAKVVVAGYPLLFNGKDCQAATFFSAAEMSQLNASTGELNTLIGTRAKAAGHRFADVRSAFTGHATCDSAAWINGLSLPIVESYHPNRPGNQAYASVVAAALDGRTTASSPLRLPDAGTRDGASARGEAASPSLDGRSASTAPAELRAQADQVLSLKLTSPANLAKARAAGVDVSLLKRAVAQLRSKDPATVQRGLTTLQGLDATAEQETAD